MQIKKLLLSDFRNYAAQEIGFSPGVNVFYGDNAQGKTNILEAVSVFSYGRSQRAVHERELIRFGRERFLLEGEFFSRGRDNDARITFDKNGQKNISVNGLEVRRMSDLMGLINIIFFGPDDLDLIKGGPQRRRRSLDILLCQISLGYFAALAEYRKIIANKNILLKKIKLEKRFASTLPVWNEKLCAAGAKLIVRRRDCADLIQKEAGKIYGLISRESESLGVKYLSCVGETEGRTVAEIEGLLREKTEKCCAREIDCMEASVGPHRDDLEFSVGGRDARAYGSQGQQKSAVLAYKMAEVEIIKNEIGEYPVLLLDDVMSQLDGGRRQFVMDNIKNIQTLVTANDAELFGGGGAKMFCVENGRVTAIQSPL